MAARYFRQRRMPSISLGALLPASEPLRPGTQGGPCHKTNQIRERGPCKLLSMLESYFTSEEEARAILHPSRSIPAANGIHLLLRLGDDDIPMTEIQSTRHSMMLTKTALAAEMHLQVSRGLPARSQTPVLTTETSSPVSVVTAASVRLARGLGKILREVTGPPSLLYLTLDQDEKQFAGIRLTSAVNISAFCTGRSLRAQ
ncbi:hypothetical protein K474DRAFT_1676059 [Panus rudis PR-1116 ss-1]|nr:hypothetical protein K474DRAFT_1676059 [Panus rudis PR-1116 ss-1]